ncbi:hypothetical protein KCV87_32820 [Actinosynnema pretiosum subsp. pretiosum]|uniref:Uncharacterized protein n=1 Tax=Actinosynnema pretiosum subsp. pretiosum TaxID=103721 RepID=A0AA45L5R5_9PSEU|nr:hypothetical protein KCV87_32820 [Actinosynnema pretiosum subsp. pretiosum]
MADLKVNPLLLTMIVNVHRYRGMIPGSRADLYDEICVVLLWRRSEAKGLGSEVRGDRKKVFLARLAFGMMSERIREVAWDRLIDAAHEVLGRRARPPDVDNAPHDILANCSAVSAGPRVNTPANARPGRLRSGPAPLRAGGVAPTPRQIRPNGAVTAARSAGVNSVVGAGVLRPPARQQGIQVVGRRARARHPLPALRVPAVVGPCVVRIAVSQGG